MGETSGQCAVMLNGEKLEHEFSSFSHHPIFSPNSERLAYAGVPNGQSVVVVDDVGVETDHRPIGSKLFFSPDSGHVAYMAARDFDQFVVVDGVEGESFGPPIFDEGDVIFDSPEELHYLVMRKSDVIMVHDRIVQN